MSGTGTASPPASVQENTWASTSRRVIVIDGEIKCPAPGLTCNVYSRSSGQLMREITFLSYVRVAQVDGVGFSAGDFIVDIYGMGRPMNARALGIFPHDHIDSDDSDDSDDSSYVSPLYCGPIEENKPEQDELSCTGSRTCVFPTCTKPACTD